MKFERLMIVGCALAVTGAAMAAVPASGPGTLPATSVATDSAPGSGTTSAPASMPGLVADYSTPAAAAATYVRATFANNPAAIRDAMVVPAEHQADLDAILSLSVAQHQLQEAAVSRFKADGDKAFYGEGKARVPLAAQLKALDNGTMEVAGETATLTMPAAESGRDGQKVLLKKTADGWKLDAVSLYSLDSEKAAARSALAKSLTAVTVQATKDVLSGKFTSATDAFQEYWMRMAEASKGMATTTTAAATAVVPAKQ